MTLRKSMPFWAKKVNSGPDPAAFIMTFALGASDSITLPLVSTGSYNFTVEWGDGTSDVITVWNQAQRTHTYTGQPAGDYVVTITGTCTAWSFGSVTTSRTKLKRVDQIGDTGLVNLSAGFAGCSNLLEVSGVFPSSVTNIQTIFQNCSKLTVLKSEWFSAMNTNNLFGAFDGCTLLNNIQIDAFKNLTSVTGATFVFRNCTSLTSLPTDLFRYNTSITTFESCFSGCTGLTSLPTDLFRYNTSVTSFLSCFAVCNGLTTVPADLFRYNTAVTTFNSTFNQCAGLSSIPSTLFFYNNAVTNFTNVFRLTTGLTSIPSGLFVSNTNVTTFFAAFQGSNLTSIPTGLFDTNTLVTDFRACFQGTDITSVPSGLFNNNTAVTLFGGNAGGFGVFNGCAFLTTIPTNLFNNCVNVTTYQHAFSSCTALNISISSLVAGMDMTKVTTTNQMFSGCTLLTGNGGDLIAKPKAAGYTVGTATNTGSYRTFFNCTSLTDFATIPADYK